MGVVSNGCVMHYLGVTRLSVDVADELHDGLRAASEAAGRFLTEVVREACERWLEEESRSVGVVSGESGDSDVLGVVAGSAAWPADDVRRSPDPSSVGGVPDCRSGDVTGDSDGAVASPAVVGCDHPKGGLRQLGYGTFCGACGGRVR